MKIKLQNGKATVTGKDLFPVLQKALEALPDGAISNIEAESLMYKFAPAIPAKKKTTWDWVSLAAPKDDVRAYLNGIYYNGTQVIATDGHRLHIGDADNVPDEIRNNLVEGRLHCPKLKQSLEDKGQYPDVNEIIESFGQTTSASKLVDELDIEYEIKSPTLSMVTLWDGLRLNQKYFDAAVNGMDAMTFFIDKDSILKITHELGIAYVMPLRD